MMNRFFRLSATLLLLVLAAQAETLRVMSLKRDTGYVTVTPFDLDQTLPVDLHNCSMSTTAR